MWSFFLIEYLYLSGVWQGLYLKMDTRKTVCYDEIWLCAHDDNKQYNLNYEHIWRGVCDSSNRNRISTLILKWLLHPTLILNNSNGSAWFITRVILHHVTAQWSWEKNGLWVIVVMVGGLKTKTERKLWSRVILWSGHRLGCSVFNKILNDYKYNFQYVYTHKIQCTKIEVFYSHGHLYFLVRQPIWVLLPSNPLDHQMLFKFEHVTFQVTFSFIFRHAHPWSLLCLETTCKMKSDCHLILNQWEILKRNDHNH